MSAAHCERIGNHTFGSTTARATAKVASSLGRCFPKNMTYPASCGVMIHQMVHASWLMKGPSRYASSLRTDGPSLTLIIGLERPWLEPRRKDLVSRTHSMIARGAHARTSYFTDSKTNIIYAYDYNSADGNLSNRRVFADAIAQGQPVDSFADGLCIDSEGCIWSAR